ncbi:MAG: universal stress protein [Actinomycetota bacterium]
MGYRTILVATDGSDRALIAQRRAAGLARAFWARLVIVTAFTDEGIPRDAAEDVLAYAAQEARRGEVETETRLLDGPPGEAIPAAARETWADLIVVGSLGMGRPGRFRLGSVAEQVAHAAPCDVLIVRTSGDTPSDPAAGYRRVLAGTDGSGTASEAVARAFEVAEVVHAEVALVSVGDPLLAKIALEKTVKGLYGIAPARSIPRAGDPADEIVAVAGEEGSDVVVVGNQGLSGLKGRLLGSVPGAVAHRAPCDVLVARTTGRTLDEIPPGRAGIIEVDGRKAAAYVEDDGTAHVLSARCQHLGCTVGWNATDRTWDCPCHGSRYAFDGTVIQGPATRDLPMVGQNGASG